MSERGTRARRPTGLVVFSAVRVRYAAPMTPERLRAVMEYLQGRVTVEEQDVAGSTVIAFAVPGPEEMAAAGLDAEVSGRVLTADWFAELIDEVVTTPEFCDPGDPPELVLRYARDVVAEYIRKRFVP